MNWRLLSTPALDGAANMAVDVALMHRARATGESAFRTYQWCRPTVSLGRNQTARDGYDAALLDRRGIDVVRRPTGGRAILHWRELTYSVTAPADGRSTLAADYARINTVLLRALRGLGIQAAVLGKEGETERPGMRPCFAAPSAGEIVLRTGAGGKLVGSAQFRDNGAFLQHGSILLHDDQPLLRDLNSKAGGETQAAALSDVLQREVTASEIEQSLFAAARELLDPDAKPLEFEPVRAAAAECEAHFRDPLWTWRR